MALGKQRGANQLADTQRHHGGIVGVVWSILLAVWVKVCHGFPRRKRVGLGSDCVLIYWFVDLGVMGCYWVSRRVGLSLLVVESDGDD